MRIDWGMADPIIVCGIHGSPYTRKMLAVLRYRRIPYRLITPATAAARGLPQPKVPLLPTLYLSGPAAELEAVTDSSPVIRRLELEHDDRKVVPSDPVMAFIDMLLEDYGDEWLTKAMFHYRWVRDADIKRAGDLLPLWFDPIRPDVEIAAESKSYSRRQIDRLHVVGSSPQTGPLIEQSYLRFLDAMNAHLREHPFLMGARPGSSDFALYGQLTQLAQFDPTPMTLTLERAPRVYAYSTRLEDLSGAEPVEADWFSPQSMPATLAAVLREAGRTYVPVMLANADALERGAGRVEANVDGKTWVQAPFPYQAKCLMWLREAYDRVDPTARATIDGVLTGTGCEQLVN